VISLILKFFANLKPIYAHFIGLYQILCLIIKYIQIRGKKIFFHMNFFNFIKKTVTLIFFVFVAKLSYTQSASGYTFSTNSTGSLVNMTGSTTVVAASSDDIASTLYTFFPFHFGGHWYTAFSVNSNGGLRLGSTAISTSTYGTSFPVANQNLIAPYLGDLATHSTGKVHVLISGSAPNRILTVEWLNMEINYSSTVVDGTFQCRLYEATGEIEFIYGSMKVTGTTTTGGGQTVRIGISTNNTSGNVFSVNQTNYSTDNSSSTAITNTNSASGTITSLNSSSDGSRRVFKFTPNKTFVIFSSGSGTWAPPCGVNTVTVETWGGGGGGGSSNGTTNNGGAGGGGGGYAKSTISVTPNTNYYYSVGTGGSGAPASSTSTAGDGNPTWFNASTTSPYNSSNSAPTSTSNGINAKGGLKGANNSTATQTNGGSSNIGVTINNGGNGAAATASVGGGGGASGGSLGVGGNGTGTAAGIPNSGAGGYGGASIASTNGNPGVVPGGGGGGSDDVAATAGGSGASGYLVISYDKIISAVAPTSISSTTSTGCPNYTTTLTQNGGTLGTGGTWKWYSGSCGGTLVGSSSSADASILLSVLEPTTFYVRSEGACSGTTSCASISLSITPVPGCATSLSPNDGLNNVPASGTTLSWAAGTGSPTSYDVYLSSVQNDVINNSPSAKIVDNQNITNTSTGSLSGSTTYYWKVVPKNCGGDATGCSVYSFTTAIPCTAPTFTTTQTNVLCNGQSTGSISVSASGGQTPYQYSKDNGQNWSVSSSFSSLSAGNYTILVKGDDGCQSSNSIVSITQPSTALSVNAGSDVTSCVGVNNTLGASPTASGGTGSYGYSWSSNPAGFNSTSANPVVSPSTTTTYTLTVTDGNGCQSTDNVTITIGSGQTKNWIGSGNGGASTDFNTASNWSPSGVPQPCDDVVISFTSGGTCLVSANTTIKSLQVSASGNITPRFGLGQNITLEVLENTSISNSTGGTNWIDITVHNGSLFIFNGNFTTTSTANSTYIFEGYGATNTHTTGKWRFKGNVTLGLYTVTYSSALCGGVEFDGSGTQTYTHNTNNTITMSSSTGSGVRIGLNNSPTVNFSGSGTTNPTAVSLNVTANSTLDLGSKSLNATSAGGTLTLGSNSFLKLAGVNIFPSGYTNHSISSTNTVEYYGTTQTITSPLNSSQTYGNLIISQSGTKTAQAALTVVGSLTVNTNATLALSTFTHNITGQFTNSGTTTFGSTGTLNLSSSLVNSGTITCGGSNNINITGDFTNTGTLNPSTSTVNFNSGTGTQQISGNTTFYNLTLSNGSTRNFGSSTYTISNNLTASGGTMTPSTSTFIFTGATGSISGANAKNFYNLQINSGSTISNSTGGNIFVNNSYTNNGTLNQAAGINFNMNASGGSTQTMSGNGNSVFGNFLIPNSCTVNATNHNFTISGTNFNVSSVSGVFNGGSATVTFDNSVSLGAGNGAYNFNNVVINNTKSFNVNNKNISVSGNWTNNGTFTPGTATVIFNKTSGFQTLNNGSSQFNNLSHTGFGDLSFSSNTTINNNLTNTDGSLTFNSNTITIGGNYSNSISNGLNSGSSTVIFNKSTGTQTLQQEPGSDFFNITHNSNGTLQLLSDISMTGDLINSSGLFDVNSIYNITIEGNWTNTSTFNSGSAWVAFAKPTGTQTVNNGVSIFNEFRYVGGGTLDLSSVAEIQSTVVIDGSMSSTSQIELMGTSDQTITSNFSSATISNLKIDKSSGLVTLDKPIKISNTLTMSSGDIVSSSLNMLEIGTSSSNTGSINWTSGIVRGPLKRWFSSSTNTTQSSGIFPVGANIIGKGFRNRYAQVNFTSAPEGGYIIAKYITGEAPTGYNGLPITYNGNQYVQNYEEEGYWELTPYNSSNIEYGSLNNSSYTLKLRLNDPSTNNGNSINSINSLRIISSKGPNHSSWVLAGLQGANQSVLSNGDYLLEETGVVGFSWFNAGGNDYNPLPVELLNFSANCVDNGVLIEWQTASEHNTSHFNLEKSRNGIDWNIIHTEQAAGNSNQLITYNFTDTKSIDGLNYYRLQQYDLDGVYETFGPMSINCLTETSAYFSIFPNPSLNTFNIIVNNDRLVGEAQLVITNDIGKEIYMRDIKIIQGINLFNIDKLDVAPGVYYVSIINNQYSTVTLKQIIR
jgi:hypothetical protein